MTTAAVVVVVLWVTCITTSVDAIGSEVNDDVATPTSDERGFWAFSELRARLSGQSCKQIIDGIVANKLHCIECENRVNDIRDHRASHVLFQWTVVSCEGGSLLLRHDVYPLKLVDGKHQVSRSTPYTFQYVLPFVVDTQVVASSEVQPQRIDL